MSSWLLIRRSTKGWFGNVWGTGSKYSGKTWQAQVPEGGPTDWTILELEGSKLNQAAIHIEKSQLRSRFLQNGAACPLAWRLYCEPLCRPGGTRADAGFHLKWLPSIAVFLCLEVDEVCSKEVRWMQMPCHVGDPQHQDGQFSYQIRPSLNPFCLFQPLLPKSQTKSAEVPFALLDHELVPRVLFQSLSFGKNGARNKRLPLHRSSQILHGPLPRSRSCGSWCREGSRWDGGV